MNKYVFITKKELKLLNKICNALGIEVKDLLEVQNIAKLIEENKALKTRIEQIEFSEKNMIEIINKHSSVITEIDVKLTNMENEKILRGD